MQDLAPSHEGRRAMVIRVVGSLMLLWNGHETPLDQEWSDVLALFQARGTALRKVLAITEGGAPSPTQQVQLSRVLGGSTMLLAIVSDGIGVRFAVSSVSLFLKGIRAFRLDELEAAYRHLQLTDEQRATASAFVGEVLARASDGR